MIANIDGGEYLELLVQDRSGMVHVFQLSAPASAVLAWPQYGFDSCNSFYARDPGDREESPGTNAGQVGHAALSVGPNPLGRAAARAFFTLDSAQHVTLEVFDLEGRRVETLLDTELPAGDHTVTWDGSTSKEVPAAGGIYFLRLTSARGTDVRKVSLTR